MIRRVTRRVGARGVAVLAAAPLLGVVPLLGADMGAYADGPGPSGHKGQHKGGHGGKGHAESHEHPGKGTKARSVRLHTSGPGKTLLPGRTYDWPFAVTAKGTGKAGHAVVRATLPKTLEFVSGRPGCAARGWTVECDLGPVKPGRTVAGMIRAKVAKRARPDAKIRVPAKVAWRGKRDSATFPVARVARTADLVMTKKAPATARTGTAIPYELKIRNRGPATAENVFVHATGPVRLVAGNAACVPEEEGFVCGVGALRPGESRTLRFKVLPARDVRVGKVLKYRSRVTSSTTDLVPANNTASVHTKITAKKSPAKKPSTKPSKKHAPKKHASKKAHGKTAQTKRGAGR